jgi:hypothetical protein
MREVGNLGAVTVAFTPKELREIDNAVPSIKVERARLPQPSMELTRREAPLKN